MIAVAATLLLVSMLLTLVSTQDMNPFITAAALILCWVLGWFVAFWGVLVLVLLILIKVILGPQ